MVTMLLSFACGAPISATTPTDLKRAEELIRELKSFKCPSSDGTSNPCSLVDLTYEPKFYSNVFTWLEAPKPKATINAQVKELIGMGAKALPKLLEFVDDNTQTGFVVNHNARVMGGMWHGSEYDSRYADPEKRAKTVAEQPPLPNSKPPIGGEASPFPATLKSYRLTVGDLCFDIIGQIVNRGLNPVRGQPTNCIILSSPSHTPGLATLVRRDWAGVTGWEHRDQLITDVYREDVGFARGAMQRLMFFYPVDGEALAVRMLNRPLYSWDQLSKIYEKSPKSDDPKVWRQTYDKVAKEFGRELADSEDQSIHYWWVERFDPYQRTGADRKRELKRLAFLFPKYKPYSMRFVNAADLTDHQDLLGAVRCFPSQKIDAAAHTLFHRAITEPVGAGRRVLASEKKIVEGWADGIALSSYWRNKGKGHDAEYRSYFRRRLKVMPKPEYGADQDIIDRMKTILAAQ